MSSHGETSDAGCERSFRIVCTGETWLGSDARAAFMALRRLGSSVHVLDEQHFIPARWRSRPMRAVQRAVRPMAVRELSAQAKRAATWFKPHCLFVFKGRYIQPDVVRYYQSLGVPTVNYYPDGGFLDFGPNIPATLPLYDHVFTTKSFGVTDMRRELGVERSSYLDHGYDPEIHRPLRLSAQERLRFGCDVAFVGSWRPQKELLVREIRRALPDVDLKVWGAQWEKATSPELAGCVMGDEILADEYSKAIQGARIALGLLTEQRRGASSGDTTTARTFQIPACGAFMLHERSADAMAFYEDGREAAFFGSPEELVAKVRYYLANDAERLSVARAGQQRARAYSADERMRVVLQWLAHQPTPAW